MKRRGVILSIGGLLAAAGAAGYWALRPKEPPVGFTLPQARLDEALALMEAHPVIDSHAHPGRTFVRDADAFGDWKIRLYAMRGSFEPRAVGDMRAGHVAASVMNGVADFQLLALTKGGLKPARDFAPGEAWSSGERQVGNLRALADDGLVTLCLRPEDVTAAHGAGQVGAIMGMEGADFIENDPERLAQVFDEGVRMVTLVHYHDNGLGHVMTGTQNDQGLTDLGRQIVSRADDLGMMIDLSHASEPTAFDVLAASRQPVVLTHTHINTPALSHPRFVSEELAQAVAERGGYIGAWPAGIGQTTLAEFIDRIEWLIDVMGEDHVALGSDMDANYKPVLETYRKMPLVVGALLERGHGAETVTRIMGGNFLRVWRQTRAGAA